jgi:predicted RND superfamily exporter protein
MFEFARAEDDITVGQLRGLSFALVGVGLVLLGIFRDARLALITLLGNIVPLVLGFGSMGLLRIPLDAGTVIVGNLAFGIAVDETLHLASAFHERRRVGLSASTAVLESLRHCLPSILYTTAAVALGFSAFAFSEFSFTRNLGILTAAVMVLCLLADALLMPALLLSRDDDDGLVAGTRATHSP